MEDWARGFNLGVDLSHTIDMKKNILNKGYRNLYIRFLKIAYVPLAILSVKELAAKFNNLSSTPWKPRDPRREQNLDSCSLISTQHSGPHVPYSINK